MMNLQNKIAAIKQKIQALNKKRKDKAQRFYKFNPVLSEKEVQSFESQHGISLPEEYRVFLMEIGNGNHEEDERNIRPLQDACKISYLDLETLDLQTPFPFNAEVGLEIIKAQLYEGIYFPETVHAIIDSVGMVDVTGCIILNYENWGTSFTALVVSGSERGKVWHVNDLYNPHVIRKGNEFKTLSFLEWVEQALDNELHPSGLDLLKAGQFEEVKELNLWEDEIKLEIVSKCKNLSYFYLSKNIDFETLPESIGHLKKLIAFKFNGGSLKQLPNQIGELENLEILELSSQQFSALPESIGKLKNLKRLSLSWNRGELKQLPASFANLQGLLYLDIDYCDELDLSQALPLIGALPLLKSIELYTNAIPEQIICLQHIESLTIHKVYGEENKVDFHENIGKLTQLKRLRLSNCGMPEIPESVCNLKNLEVLYLGINPLRALPDAIGKLRKLKTISLESTNIEQLPVSFRLLQNLEKIEFGGSHKLNFENVCNTLSYLPKVKRLYLETYQKIPHNIGHLTHIEDLIIHSYHENEQIIPEHIRELTGLDFLSLTSKGTIVFPAEFSGLKKLRILRIKANQVYLPDNFGELKNLAELKITDANISHLPASFDALENLEELDLEGNVFSDWTVFFRTIARLPKLKKLRIAAAHLPAEIGLCTQLEKLEIFTILDNKEHLKLMTLPPEIGELVNLKSLVVSDNKLKEIPKEIGKLKNLTYLSLGENEFVSLPESIGNLVNLREFELSEGKLKSLPDSIGEMENLMHLCADKNELEILPESIGKLKNLRRLYLQENKLVSLPDSIRHLQNLLLLNVSKNQLKILPESLSDLSYLKELVSEDNPLVSQKYE